MTAQPFNSDNGIAAMLRVAARFGKPADGSTLRQQMRWFQHLAPTQQLERLARLLGLHLMLVPHSKLRWRQEIVPVLLLLENGSVALIEEVDSNGGVRYWLSESGDVVRAGQLQDLLMQADIQVGVVGVAARARDARIDEFVQPYQPHWFWHRWSATCWRWRAFCFPCRCTIG